MVCLVQVLTANSHETLTHVSGVTQCSVLGSLLFLLYIVDLPRLLQNELVGYAGRLYLAL